MIRCVDQNTFSQNHNEYLFATHTKYLRFQLLIPLLQKNPDKEVKYWSAGREALCALFHRGTLSMGDLNETYCKKIIGNTRIEGIRKIAGDESVIKTAVEYCEQAGLCFFNFMYFYSMILNKRPEKLDTSGKGRLANSNDLDLIESWLEAFGAEAFSNYPQFSKERHREIGQHYIKTNNLEVWQVDGEVVSMAAIVNKTPKYGAISLVYTNPEYRNKGYAAAVVRSLAEKVIYDKKIACLYIDASNPVSRRCYEKIGFQVTESHAEATVKKEQK